MALWLLRNYLRWQGWIYDRVMYHVAPRCFGGSHPKNVFHYRSEFFVENVGPEDNVLDLACGQGAILKNLAPKIHKGFGVEQNTRQIALARQNAPGNLRFVEADIFDPSVQKLVVEERVNKVVLSHILEHLPDPVNFLKQLLGREVLICVPSQENWYRQLLKHLGLQYLSDPTHYREYTRAELREHLEAAGYQIVALGFNSEGEITCRARSRQG